MKKIYCQISKCLSCHSCEIACAIAHSESKELTAAINEDPLPRQLIKVEYIDESGKIYKKRSIAVQCRQCEDPQCLQACITGGIYMDRKTGSIMFEHDKCVGCWSCIMVCPFGVIVRHEENRKAAKCDLCPGEEIPPCVRACPTKALIYCEKKEIKVGQLE